MSDASARWLFFRLLGVAYLCAFWSLAGQIVGLVGHDGILPAAAYMDGARHWAASQQIGVDRIRLLPTIFWAGAADSMLRAVCLAGVLLSVLLIAGVAPLVILPLLWASYLSLSVVARDFLAFQWDALLLESGLLALFVAPAVWFDRWGRRTDPPRVGVWLLYWLLFRLMLGSGLVKLASGDPTWRSLTALRYHYETQPIPTPLAWYAHQLPLWFQKASTLAALAIEIAGALLMLVPRRGPRLAACVIFVGLQALIAATGNYAFFNLLTASLCVFLLAHRAGERPRHSRGRRVVIAIPAAVLFAASAVTFAGSLGLALPGTAVAEPIATALAPFRSINSYGLFAVMTTTRPEVIIEGSDDGAVWQAYEFKYKVGDPRRAPPWIEPFQPRLDWQMWFAALGRYEDNPWFGSLCVRLLEGSADVLRLLATDPFAGRAPRFIRAVLYQYHFADAQTRRAQGVWWTRERLGDYLPPTSLDAFRRASLQPAVPGLQPTVSQPGEE